MAKENINKPPDQHLHGGFFSLDRRVFTPDRRKNGERRSLDERRFDIRLEPVQLHKKIKIWLSSLTHPRLGIDRRKKNDRRKNSARRHKRLEPLLTPEELADLLS